MTLFTSASAVFVLRGESFYHSPYNEVVEIFLVPREVSGVQSGCYYPETVIH